MLVQCKKTGKWYDPQKEWERICKEQWFINLMKRLKDK